MERAAPGARAVRPSWTVLCWRAGRVRPRMFGGPLRRVPVLRPPITVDALLLRRLADPVRARGARSIGSDRVGARAALRRFVASATDRASGRARYRTAHSSQRVGAARLATDSPTERGVV